MKRIIKEICIILSAVCIALGIMMGNIPILSWSFLLIFWGAIFFYAAGLLAGIIYKEGKDNDN